MEGRNKQRIKATSMNKFSFLITSSYHILIYQRGYLGDKRIERYYDSVRGRNCLSYFSE